MKPDEAFSLKAVAAVVNSLGFDEVVVCDPHSDVTPALVENVRVVPQVELVAAHDGLRGLLSLREEKVVVVAPDAGAAKKALSVAQRLGRPLVTASKARDTATGEIAGTELHSPLDGADVWFVSGRDGSVLARHASRLGPSNVSVDLLGDVDGDDVSEVAVSVRHGYAYDRPASAEIVSGRTGATLWSASVAGKAVRPGVAEKDAVLLALEKGRAGQDAPTFAVRITYVQSINAWDEKGPARLTLPALDLPISRTGSASPSSSAFR